MFREQKGLPGDSRIEVYDNLAPSDDGVGHSIDGNLNKFDAQMSDLLDRYRGY
jgi:hypothetical protein